MWESVAHTLVYNPQVSFSTISLAGNLSLLIYSSMVCSIFDESVNGAIYSRKRVIFPRVS